MKKEEFVSKMTLKEKAEATVMQNGRCFVTERLGNDGFKISDNPRGDEDYVPETPEQRKAGYHPVAFPQAAAAAACWDANVSYEIGKAMGRNCKDNHIDVLLRPGVNIKRSPLCGRNFEYYSEDPVVAGELGGAFIEGVQSEGTAACLKHYAANSQEFERMTTNAVVSKRALRELYLKAFEIAVRKCRPWTVMTSYNKVNGYWVPENEELMKLLRQEFGFDGAVISDAMAVQTKKVRSQKYGLDFEIGTRGVHTQELQDAIEQGELEEKILDESILKLLALQEKIAEVRPKGYLNPEEDHALARRLASEGVVLLKNDGILPLDAKGGEKIAIIGYLAKEPNYMGGGSGHMNGWRIDITYDEIMRIAEGGCELSFARAYETVDRKEKEKKANQEYIDEAVKAAKAADTVLFFTGLPQGYESEGYDRESLALPADMLAALDAVLEVAKKTVLVNASGSAVDLSAYVDRVNAVLHSYLAGEAMGGALADVLFGLAEPGGQLTETFPLRLKDTPAYLSFPHYPTVMPDVLYGEDIFVGYRWYEKREIPVLFPFGHGLSYTTFEYGGLKADRKEFSTEDTITVSVTVKNTGSRRGSQAVQLYVRALESGFVRPVKELKAFRKVWLEAGSSETVEFKLNRAAFECYDEKRSRWVAETGDYEILIGASAQEIKGSVIVSLKNGEQAQTYHYLTAVEWFTKNKGLESAMEHAGEKEKDLFLGTGDTLADLICCLPVYRFTEDILLSENDALSRSTLSDMIDKLNRNNT